MIRLQRIGRKNDPAFRMVVTEKTASPTAGKYVDLLGTYNPKTKAFTVAGERVKEWMAKGAQLSPSLQNLLISKGIIEGKKISVVSEKKLNKNKKDLPAQAGEPAPAASTPVEAAPAAEVAEATVEEPKTEEASAEALVEEEAAAPAA